MTNFEKIKNMSAEELVDKGFVGGGYDCHECPIKKACLKYNVNRDDEMIVSCSDFWKFWLNSEMEE